MYLHFKVAWKSVEPVPTVMYPMNVMRKMVGCEYFRHDLMPLIPSQMKSTLVKVFDHEDHLRSA